MPIVVFVILACEDFLVNLKLSTARHQTLQSISLSYIHPHSMVFY
jgi:hypothetical protein